MTPLLLTDIERAVRSSWGADTCTPEFRAHWTPGNPARDQCGTTALVVNDLLGGELLRGEVLVDGRRTDYHWWNRLGMGVEVDLTREQFGRTRSSPRAWSSPGRRRSRGCARSTSCCATGLPGTSRARGERTTR
ncbi:hypothetical protein GCM10009802_18500 [Streptomyces synnematoformans]|uniref:Uncharacterized protein n=1 Tax=Streptomyces synnematoformans TaxID=415721 RepID=A0ABN2XWL4_9ACTN